MILLVDELPWYILTLSKIAAAIIIVTIGFKFYRLKSFIISLLVFLFVNFLFLGIIIGIYFLSGSNAISINNSIVYFNISARGLLASAFFAYILSCVIVKIYNRSLSKGDVYTITIESEKGEVTLFAFSDTGNKLREPFSNLPVIIVDKEKVEPIVNKDKIRLIPTKTVNSNSFLISFKPKKVVLKASGKEEILDNVYVALSDEINNDDFSAIINPEILSVWGVLC